MSHLTLEDLARLIDEEPSEAEALHLEACALCANELEAFRSDQAALRDLPDLLHPPPGAWPALAERLRDEGLIRDEVPGAGRLEPAPAGRRILQMAAAISIFILGGGVGFLVSGGSAGGGATMSPPGGRVAGQSGAAEVRPGSRGYGLTGSEIAALSAALSAESGLSGSTRRESERALTEEGATTIGARLRELSDLRIDLDSHTRPASTAHHLAGASVAGLNSGLAHYFEGRSEGVLVLDVRPGSPAERSGLRAGDILVSVLDRPVRSPAELWEVLDEFSGDGVEVELVRRGVPLSLELLG